MTKNDLTEAVRNVTNCPKRDADTLVDSVLDILKDTLASGEDVMISGFGKFVIQSKNDRLGRNPQTGEPLTITARKILTFKPSSLLKEEINRD
ncbi:MAG: integration host factor subunit alpha [Geobacteraceae bacterium]|nr:integration host factor subunit alpha [Geobacteraceae bacterium]